MNKPFYIKYNEQPVSIIWLSTKVLKAYFYEDCMKRNIKTLKEFILYANELGLRCSVKQNKSSVRGKDIYFIDCEVYDNEKSN